MLEHLRQNRRIARAVTALFAVLLLVAMLSGVRVRAVTHQDGAADVHALVGADICSVGHGAGGLDVAALATNGAGQVPDESSHQGHHGVDCVLCIALAPQEGFRRDVHYPPVPPFRLAWSLLGDAIPAPSNGAPFPPRGPPTALV